MARRSHLSRQRLTQIKRNQPGKLLHHRRKRLHSHLRNRNEPGSMLPQPHLWPVKSRLQVPVTTTLKLSPSTCAECVRHSCARAVRNSPARARFPFVPCAAICATVTKKSKPGLSAKSFRVQVSASPISGGLFVIRFNTSLPLPAVRLFIVCCCSLVFAVGLWPM